MNRTTIRRKERWPSVLCPALAAFAMVAHAGELGAAVNDAEGARWSVQQVPGIAPTVASYFQVYEVRAADLRFLIEYSHSDGGLKVREAPSPFRALGRQDLVPLLEAAIRDTGVAHAMAGAVAIMVLPHVGTTQAASAYLLWGRRYGWGRITWLSWPPPLPSDAKDPPAWIEHLADPPIADTLTSWAAAVRCEAPYDQLYVLCLLGASPSPSAASFLGNILGRNRECQARLMDSIVHGGLAIREETWDQIMQRLPNISRRPTIARDFHAVNILWHDIAQKRRWPPSADRASRLELLGSQFVHNVLSDPQADSILCSADDPPRVSPMGAMSSYAGDGLGPFLRVCRAFGRAEDSRSLERLLGRFETLLRDSSLAQQWDWMRVKWQGSREDVIEEFSAERDSTIAAVKARR